MSARSAWPSSNASHIATARPSSTTSNPVDANASQLGTRPSGMTRIALASAKNSVAIDDEAGDPTRVATAAAPLEHRTQRGQRDGREHHPVARPQRPVDISCHRRADERHRGHARHQRDFAGAAAPGVARPGQFDEHREPRDTRDGDQVDLDAAENVGLG